MNAAEILFEAYDLLPVPEEREFLKRVLQRVNLNDLAGVMGEALDWDQMTCIVALLQFDGETDEVEALHEIHNKRQQRKRKARMIHERAERIKANAAKSFNDPRNPYTNEKSFSAFIKARLGDNWYIAGRPLKKYQGSDMVNITQAKYNKLYAEWEQTK